MKTAKTPVTRTDHGNETRRKILEYIREYIKVNQFSPTHREIAKALNISISGVHTHTFLMQLDGIITSKPGTARTLRIKEGNDKC